MNMTNTGTYFATSIYPNKENVEEFRTFEKLSITGPSCSVARIIKVATSSQQDLGKKNGLKENAFPLNSNQFIDQQENKKTENEQQSIQLEKEKIKVCENCVSYSNSTKKQCSTEKTCETLPENVTTSTSTQDYATKKSSLQFEAYLKNQSSDPLKDDCSSFEAKQKTEVSSLEEESQLKHFVKQVNECSTTTYLSTFCSNCDEQFCLDRPDKLNEKKAETHKCSRRVQGPLDGILSAVKSNCTTNTQSSLKKFAALKLSSDEDSIKKAKKSQSNVKERNYRSRIPSFNPKLSILTNYSKSCLRRENHKRRCQHVFI